MLKKADLHVLPKASPEINDALVQCLKELLEKAEKGEIDHLIAVGYSSGTGDVVNGFSFPENEEKARPYMVLGILSQMTHEIHHWLSDYESD